MNKLILVRGLPGSGKSTFAQTIIDLAGAGAKNSIVTVAADDFMVDADGNYKFDPSRLSYVHDECQRFVKAAMNFGINTIIVHNTFTQEWEMNPYFALAEQYKYEVTSIVVENRHGNKSIHDVPDERVEKMRDRFDISL